MSGVSPGSAATTSLFMVLTLLAMGVLILRDSEPEPTCDERLERMGTVRWDPNGAIPHPGEAYPVTYRYTVEADGTLSDIQLQSAPTPYDKTARQALEKSRYKPAKEAQLCSHTFTMRID